MIKLTEPVFEVEYERGEPRGDAGGLGRYHGGHKMRKRKKAKSTRGYGRGRVESMPAAFTVKVERPRRSRVASVPDFHDWAGFKQTTKPGECKNTGCYGKFFFENGKPKIQLCVQGKPGKTFQVKNAKDAREKTLKSCTIIRKARR